MSIVENKLKASDCFLVDINILSSRKITVYIDKGTGVSASDCAAFSKILSPDLDAAGLLDMYELEVSSPGADQPFKVLQQYHKNIGRNVSIYMTDGSEKKGILKAVTEDTITLHLTPDNKKRGRQGEEKNIKLPFNQIKETKTIILFNKKK